MQHTKHTGASGFTLIEVMIVVAIVAILAAIALPSYQESVRKSRRADARAQLMEVAQYMERFYSQNDRYDKVNDNSGTDVSIPSALTTVPRGGSSGSTYYTIGFQDETLTPRGFTLEAVPTGAQANDRCGTLRLSSVGQRTKDGGSDDMSAADCWR